MNMGMDQSICGVKRILLKDKQKKTGENALLQSQKFHIFIKCFKQCPVIYLHQRPFL